MRPDDPGSEAIRRALLAAARERLREHLAREAGTAAEGDAGGATVAEVQQLVERLGTGT